MWSLHYTVYMHVKWSRDWEKKGQFFLTLTALNSEQLFLSILGFNPSTSGSNLHLLPQAILMLLSWGEWMYCTCSNSNFTFCSLSTIKFKLALHAHSFVPSWRVWHHCSACLSWTVLGCFVLKKDSLKPVFFWPQNWKVCFDSEIKPLKMWCRSPAEVTEYTSFGKNSCWEHF